MCPHSQDQEVESSSKANSVVQLGNLGLLDGNTRAGRCGRGSIEKGGRVSAWWAYTEIPMMQMDA